MQQFVDTLSDGLPNICGCDTLVDGATSRINPVFLARSDVDFGKIRGTFAIALHMHQPLIPAGGTDLQSASVISNLRFMAEHPEVPDAHNSPAFRWCYKRMGEFIPQLLAEGKRPRIMLDYSGCLLHGLLEMGAGDVIEALKPLAQNPGLRDCVEWLGTAWGHAVAPSTPVQDFRLHVRAWQHHFAAIFGLEALSRVRGFSPPEMALPNHPDVCHEFVRTLLDCGYRWVLVQESSVENAETGGPVKHPHLPQRLIARNSRGQSASIIAIIKTQGSDTKLVGQMQPYYEAMGLERLTVADGAMPQMVVQIGDGENGGVMMNEFPSKFMQVVGEAAGSATPAMNVTEYLEHCWAMGLRPEDFPEVRPLFQKRIGDRMGASDGPEKLEQAITELRSEDARFHMEGGSWTGNISWVRGYENVLGPMASVSAAFSEKFGEGEPARSDAQYHEALFYLLLTQTSCFRYWGQGVWTDYAKELCRRASEVISRNT